MLDSEDNCLHINIRRDEVGIDAMQKAKNKKFDPRKLIQVIYCYQEYYVTLSATKSHCRLFIQVTFVGEGAIDHGGPRREFFRLLALETSKCNTTFTLVTITTARIDYLHVANNSGFLSTM